jgi:hypothetical protein
MYIKIIRDMKNKKVLLGVTDSGKEVYNVKSSKGFTEADLLDAQYICNEKLGFFDDLTEYFYKKFKAAQNGVKTYREGDLRRGF